MVHRGLLASAMCVAIFVAITRYADASRPAPSASGGALSLDVLRRARSLLTVRLKIVSGNPNCPAGYIQFSTGTEPSLGKKTYGGLFTITTLDGVYFDWEVVPGIAVGIVYAKGGNQGAYQYTYGPDVTSDTGLRCPDNCNPKTGKCTGPAAISHVKFCYNYKTEVTVEAKPSFKRTYTWSLSKVTVPTSGLTEPYTYAGENVDWKWIVTVPAPTSGDSDFAVDCTMTVSNPSPVDITAFTADCSLDVLPLPSASTVTCAAASIPAGKSTTCTKTFTLSSGTNGIATGTVTVTTPTGFLIGSDTDDFAFVTPTTTVDGSADLTDLSPPGATPPVSIDMHILATNPKFPVTVPISASQKCPTTAGAYTDGLTSDIELINTAYLKPKDTTEKTARATFKYRCRLRELTTRIVATSTWNRAYTWTVDKTVTPTTQTGQAGDPALTATFTVTVNEPSHTDSGRVTCTASVTNPASFPVTFTAKRDPDIAIGCDNVLLGPGASKDCNCSFTEAVASPFTRSVTVNFAINGDAAVQTPPPRVASYTYDTNPNTYTNDQVDVKDQLEDTPVETMLGTLSATGSFPRYFEVDDSFICPASLATTLTKTRFNLARLVVSGGVKELSRDDATTTYNCVVREDTPTGGEPWSPGHWTNWNRCSGGNQAETADDKGGPTAGYWLVDDFLPLTWYDDFTLNCSVAVDILERRIVLNGRVQASDPARYLARNLLTAYFDKEIGSCYIDTIQQAYEDGIAILASIDFTGLPKEDGWITDTNVATAANTIAAYLDTWWHNCPPPTPYNRPSLPILNP